MDDQRTVRLGMWFEFTPKTKIEEQNTLRCLYAMYKAMQKVPGVGNCGYENSSAESFEVHWNAKETTDNFGNSINGLGNTPSAQKQMDAITKHADEIQDEHEFQPSADMKEFIAKSVKDARQMIQSKEPIRQCPSGIPTISQIHGKNGVEFQWSCIHNNEDGFDSDLVALDRVYWKDGEVVYADRLFRIPSPKWLQRFFFGKEINS